MIHDPENEEEEELCAPKPIQEDPEECIYDEDDFYRSLYEESWDFIRSRITETRGIQSW